MRRVTLRIVAEPFDSSTPTAPAVLDGAAEGLVLQIIGDGFVSRHALPPAGTVTIGRSDGAWVQIPHASISRQHAVLHVGARLLVEDLGSANGTRVSGKKLVPRTPTPVAPGEPIDFGSVLAIVQPGAAGAARPLWAQEHFDARLAALCRSPRRGFAVLRVRVDDLRRAGDVHAELGTLTRTDDLLCSLGPGDFGVILPERAPDEAEAWIERARALPSLAAAARLVFACAPRDGATAAALTAKLHGPPRPGDDDGVVVADPVMQRLHELSARIAGAELSVLLLGETGVGKEVLAQRIHRRSPRAARPFVGLNCSALAEQLLESELFGYERGAFTGATQAKAGLLETAQGGTVFLDEIGELPLSLQAKLLRVLETRELLRIGAVKTRALDVRFIAATNRDLQAEVAARRFRQDLYFRLNGITLHVPPLRERTSEIEGLALRFLVDAARRLGKPTPRLTEAALARLRAHPWPGNVRELRNVIERAVVLADDVIAPEQIPLDAVAMLPADTRPPAPPLLPEADAERQRIVDALAQAGQNQTRAARLLGISRGTLLMRLDAYGIPRPRKRSPYAR